MDYRITYIADVVDGRLKIIRRKEFDQALLSFDGKRVEVTVQKKKKGRTLAQNKYLHLLFTIFTDCLNELGNKLTMQQVKDMLKRKFITVEVYNEETGEKIGERVRHTSELSTVELNSFIEEVIQYGAEMFNFNLPYPNEQIKIELT